MEIGEEESEEVINPSIDIPIEWPEDVPAETPERLPAPEKIPA